MYSYKGARNIDALYAFVTEGYKTAATDTIPIPPSAFEVKMKKIRKKFQDVADTNQNLKFLLEDFDHIIEFRKNAAVVLVVMGAIIGFMIGMIVCLLGGLRRAKKDAKTKKEWLKIGGIMLRSTTHFKQNRRLEEEEAYMDLDKYNAWMYLLLYDEWNKSFRSYVYSLRP